MTDQELKDLVASLAVNHATLTAKFAAEHAKTEQAIQSLTENQREMMFQLNELNRKQTIFHYNFVDEDTLFIPKMKTWLTKKLGTTQIMERACAYDNAKNVILEVKLAISSNAVYIIREDLKLQEYSFKTMLDAMKQFPILFPLYRDKMLHGIFATFHVSTEMKKKVIEAGLYLAIIHDEHFKLKVPKNFKPKNFQITEIGE